MVKQLPPTLDSGRIFVEYTIGAMVHMVYYDETLTNIIIITYLGIPSFACYRKTHLFACILIHSSL